MKEWEIKEITSEMRKKKKKKTNNQERKKKTNAERNLQRVCSHIKKQLPKHLEFQLPSINYCAFDT